MESGAPIGSRELPTLPVCQVCGLDLSNARTFFRRYRICEAHAAEKEQLIDGVPQRFCQQCGRFHTLDAFDADQKSCREELARHAARRRDLRRRRKASQGLAAAASLGGAGPSSSGQGGAADLSDLLAAAAQAGEEGAPLAAPPWAQQAAQRRPLPPRHAAAGAQALPLQRSAPAGQPTGGWSASDAQALLNTLSAGIKPAASSGLLSSTTAAHLDVPNLAALSAALAGQAGSLPPGLGLGLGAAAAVPQQPSASFALGNAASDAASGSGEYQAGLPLPAGNPSVASAGLAGLLQQLLRPPTMQIPSVRSVPLPLPQQVSLLPSAATAAPGHDPQMSAPVPGQGRGGGAAAPPATSGPVCQVCRSSLADMLPFYKRYRVCAEHMSAPEVLRDGVPSRFCQQCGRFHPLDAFDGTQRTCREELAWRRYRRTHGVKDGHGEGRIRRHHKQQLMQAAAAAAAQPAQQEQEQQQPAEQQVHVHVQQHQQQAEAQREQHPQQEQQEQQEQQGSGASPVPMAPEPAGTAALARQSSQLLGRQLLLLKDMEDAPTPRMESLQLPASKRPRLDAPPAKRQEGQLAQLATQAQQSAAPQQLVGAAARQPSEAPPVLPNTSSLPPGIAQLMQLASHNQQPSVQPLAALLAQLQQPQPPAAQQPEYSSLFAAALQQQAEAQQAAAAQHETQLAQQLAAAMAQLAPQQPHVAQQPPLLQSALLQQALGQAQNPQAGLLQQVLGQNPQTALLQMLGQAQPQPQQPALLQQLLAAAQPQVSHPAVSPMQQALEALTAAARQPQLLPQPQADAGPLALLMQLSQMPAPQQAQPQQAGGGNSADLLTQFIQLAPQQQAALLALARGQGQAPAFGQAPSFGGR
ncbi:hypothetical protein COHA_005301 [Chlorella ohadii]|uniref:SBP-type domain-containing protein n=1 Tax=Chlorella ohadii TaxID=2649997 RepID=A0AAD5DRE7_9CHLO|nr:hypothetical protein COHA_005301 [Chlorella ohadii]